MTQVQEDPRKNHRKTHCVEGRIGRELRSQKRRYYYVEEKRLGGWVVVHPITDSISRGHRHRID